MSAIAPQPVHGLLANGTLRADLQPQVEALADAWLAAHIAPDPVELLAELLARVASELGETSVDWTNLKAHLAWIELPAPVLDTVRAVLEVDSSSLHLAALALHLMDIAERMALVVYVPELPSLFARGDRTGNSARSVGLAQHLRG